jgi:hypothetical protein
MPIVPSLRTPLSVEEAKACIARAVAKRGGGEELARLITAQSDLETGTWKSIWNYNLGNIRGQFRGMTTSIPGATEYDDNGKLVVVPDGFRAYPDFDAGAEDKIDQLGRNFPKAWAAKDLASFVDGLWRGRLGSYFGVPPKDPYGTEGRRARDRYEAGVRARYSQLFPEDTPTVTLALDLPVLRQDSHGSHVLIWQKLLGVKLTGSMDSTTRTATRAFQESRNIGVDGDVGRETWSAMLS